MESQRNDFCVFILSHDRPQVDTLMMLKKYNYSGEYRIVVSNDDGYINEYKSLYKDNVIIFDKMDMLEHVDTMLPSQSFYPNASIYARAFIQEIAKRMGFLYYCMADDDITKIFHREDVNGKMKQKEIKDIKNIVFDSLIHFIKVDNRISCINPALNDGYFGGTNGSFIHTATRLPFQFMVFSTDNMRMFKGLRSEDFILSFLNFDLLYFTYWHLAIETPPMSTNAGGINYNDSLNPAMFMLIAYPSGIILKPNNKKIIKRNNVFPKIISSTNKKL